MKVLRDVFIALLIGLILAMLGIGSGLPLSEINLPENRWEWLLTVSGVSFTLSGLWFIRHIQSGELIAKSIVYDDAPDESEPPRKIPMTKASQAGSWFLLTICGAAISNIIAPFVDGSLCWLGLEMYCPKS